MPLSTNFIFGSQENLLRQGRISMSWSQDQGHTENLGQVSIWRSSGQGQGHKNKKACVSVSCLGSNFWMSWSTNFIFGSQVHLLGQGRVSRSWGQGQGHTNVTKTKPCLLFSLILYEFVYEYSRLRTPSPSSTFRCTYAVNRPAF